MSATSIDCLFFFGAQTYCEKDGFGTTCLWSRVRRGSRCWKKAILVFWRRPLLRLMIGWLLLLALERRINAIGSIREIWSDRKILRWLYSNHSSMTRNLKQSAKAWPFLRKATLPMTTRHNSMKDRISTDKESISQVQQEMQQQQKSRKSDWEPKTQEGSANWNCQERQRRRWCRYWSR